MASYDIIGGIVSEEAKKELQELERMANNIGTKLKGITIGQISKEADAALVRKLNAETEKLVAQEQKLQTQITKTSQASAQRAKATTGYINELEAEVKQLTAAYNALSKAELQGVGGQQALQNLKSKREELAGLKAAYGDMRMNVGNYSSATKMLGINIGQVLKEMPNFAISMRTGIMSLTNNLPMLAETIKQVKVEQLAMIEAGKKAPSMFGLIAKSVFGLTGFMSILMVLMQLFSEDIVKSIATLFKFNNTLKETRKIIGEISKASFDRLSNDIDKARLFALDYNKAIRDGNKERINMLEDVGKKEYNLHKDRLKQIGENINTWKLAFKEYLDIARKTYYNEALSKKLAEKEMQKATMQAERDMIIEQGKEKLKESLLKRHPNLTKAFLEAEADYFAQMWRKGHIIGGADVGDLVKDWNELGKGISLVNKEIKALEKIPFYDVYSSTIYEQEPESPNKELRDRTKDMKYIFGQLGQTFDRDKVFKDVEEKIKGLLVVDVNELGAAIEKTLRYATEMYNKGAITFEEFEAVKTKYLQQANENNVELTNELWDMLIAATDKGIQRLIEAETQQMQDRLKNMDMFFDLSLTLVDSFYKRYNDKLQEQADTEKKINDEKLKDIEDREAAGILTKEQAEEAKLMAQAYYDSQQEEMARKREEAEKRQFLLDQAAAIAKIWIQYSITAASYNAQSALAPVLAPYYQGMKVKALQEALLNSAIVAAQTIPYFAEGGIMEKSGMAILGDGGKHELAISPSGNFFVSDNKPAMYNLERGTQILPDINRIDLASVLALRQALPELSNNSEMIKELKNVTNAVRNQKQGNFYGMPLIKQLQRSEKLSSRRRSLMN